MIQHLQRPRAGLQHCAALDASMSTLSVSSHFCPFSALAHRRIAWPIRAVGFAGWGAGALRHFSSQQMRCHRTIWPSRVRIRHGFVSGTRKLRTKKTLSAATKDADGSHLLAEFTTERARPT